MFEKVSRSLKYDSNIFFVHKHICDPFWENPYKRGHQLFLFFFTYRIYGARGPRLPSLTEITQVFFELWIKTFMHNRSIIISRFQEKTRFNASLWPRGVSRFYVYYTHWLRDTNQPPGMSRTSEQCSNRQRNSER